jgi:hypothetical protein
VVEERFVDRPSGEHFGRDDREAVQPVVGVPQPPHDPVGVDLAVCPQPCLCGAGAQFLQEAGPAEHVGAPAPFDFGGCEHDLPVCAPDRFDQGVVVGDVGFLCELEVDRDHLRAGTAQAVDHPCVIAPRERRLASLGVAEVLHRGVVDRHEHYVRRGPLVAADRVPRVERLQLAAPQQVGGVGGDADAGRERGDDQQCTSSSSAR